ncbi:MAG: class I SAM-dependent methyltransferase [Saprospiraceae bacterium]|nr:class I SAM-dependent methyltransferase [Saprospiraceae bacterium]
MAKDKTLIDRWIQAFDKDEGVYLLSPVDTTFEDEYVAVRRKEGRLLADDMVAQLPDIPGNHPLAREWKKRKESGERLVQYITHWADPFILEVGCGNGWLSNWLSSVATVVGIDINLLELKQAARVFERPSFCCGDLFQVAWDDSFGFDLIILASSIQYFSDPHHTIETLMQLLAPSGEIHLIDSQIYPSVRSAKAAAIRSLKYFRDLAPGMTAKYYHHHTGLFDAFNHDYLLKPNRHLHASVFRSKSGSPFPWIRIKK